MGSHLLTALLLTLAIFGGFDGSTCEARRCYAGMPSCFPTQSDAMRLDAKMDGKIVVPEAALNYTHYNTQWNLRTKTYPLVHAVVHSVEDIREAILFARKFNLKVTVKSSGHDFHGRCSIDGSFTINLMEMKKMQVTDTATERSEYGELKVETGATWKEIYEEVHKYDRVVVGGSAHTVTPGGYTMGGGHSPISRTFGLAVDNLLEIQVVLADGRIATCTEDKTIFLLQNGTEKTENKGDLFWALRGGGGGTFGVVSYYVFKLHQAPEAMVKVTVGCAFYINTTNETLAKVVLDGFNGWIKNLPSYWGGYFIFNNIPLHIPASQETGYIAYDLTGTFSMVFNKFGPWDDNTESELQPLYDLKESYGAYITPFTLENKTSFWDYEKDMHDEPLGRVYMSGSLIPEENYNENLTKFFLDEFLHNNDDVMLYCTVVLLGGKVTNFTADSSSVNPGFRSALTWTACSVVVSAWYDFRPEVYERQDRLKPKASAFAARLRKFGIGEYINEGDGDNPNWELDNWGSNYFRLYQIKRKYDPTNFFTCHHCVGSYSAMEETTDISPATGTSFVTLVLMVLVNIFLK